jgi:hypothetical protein
MVIIIMVVIIMEDMGIQIMEVDIIGKNKSTYNIRLNASFAPR